MLASPGLTPGSGDGIAASTSDSPTAAVASQATRRSSSVTASSITDRVINLGTAGNLQADTVGRADGDFTGAHQPALLDAILAGAGIGDDTGAAGFDGDQRGTERAGHLKLLAGLEIDLGEDPALLPDDGTIGQTALPEVRDADADQGGTTEDDQPVAWPDQGQPRFQLPASVRWRTSTRAFSANSRASHSGM